MIESLLLTWHITRRNWAVYRKDFLANISPTLADPAFFMLSLGVGLGAFVTEIEGLTYTQFLAPGLAISAALMTSFFESSYGFYVRLTFENIYRAMLTTPINAREVIFGEFLWVALKGVAMTLIVSVLLGVFGLISNWWYLPIMALVGFLVALPCGAIGLIASSLVRNINQFQTIYSFLISPLFFFSGIFFPIHQLPVLVKNVMLCFPVAPGVLAMQALFWDRDVASVFFYCLILVAQSFFYCSFAFYRIEKKLIP